MSGVVQQQELDSSDIVAAQHNLTFERQTTTRMTMDDNSNCPSLTDEVRAALTCPISREVMRDPVTLVQTNQTYDREFLCHWLVDNPTQCPMTGYCFEERLEYIDDIKTRGLLISYLGKEAYQRFDESDFQCQYVAKWYDSDTLYNLALHFQNGLDIPQDIEQSRYFFVLAAERGHAKAQCMLGYTYERALGVPRDYTRARYYYELAARQGDADAQYSLGVFYERARGVSQDFGLARQYYVQAAAQGHAYAQYNLGSLCANGQGAPTDYELARQCFEFAAEQGLASAQYNIGLIYENGLGVRRNYNQAKHWYRLAAEQGHVEAQVHLEAIYHHEFAIRQKYVARFLRAVCSIAILAVIFGLTKLLARYGLAKHFFFIFINHGNAAKHIWWFLKGRTRPLVRTTRRYLGTSQQA